MNQSPDRIESIFAAAVALPSADERASYLDQACADDATLRARIEALLRAHDRAGHLLDRPISNDLEPTHALRSSEKPGVIIGGRYKLLEPIGEGGMGTVWMAEQKEPIKRKVAIKLVKAGMDSAQVLARFDAERQALALMDHPNIAKVLDGGMTEQGRPFFAMEFVKGVPLTQYCDQARLSLKERLNLFIPVCQAVQHAHQKGIIHRDLKPSNILICLYDGKPVPKVIDFGLAKALHQSLTEKTLHTAFGTMVGTPLYMSPEQAEHNNLDVDIRTDIYSLGVILYELLTGTTPLESQQLKVAAYNEILRLIKDVEPPKPSTRLSGSASLPSIAAQRSIEPKQLRKSLTGDLDWIVMKTLEKDRTRRYETVSALVTEIHRYLDGRPVEACPPSATYRIRKFASRHRTWVTVAAAFLLLVVGSSVVSSILLVQTRNARDLAVTARHVAQRDRDRALDAERVAAAHLRNATQEKKRADKHAQELKQRLYDYNISKAFSSYRDGQLTTAASFLEECLPEQRGWEWSFLQRLAKAPRSIALTSNSTLTFTLTADGMSFVTVDQDGTVRSARLSDGRVAWSQKSLISAAAQGFASTVDDRLLIVGGHAPPNQQAMDSVEGVIQSLSLRDGKPLWTQRVPASILYGVTVSPDKNQFLITATKLPERTTEIQLRSSQDGQLLWSLPAGPIANALFDKHGQKVFITETVEERLDGPSTLRCMNIADRKELWRTSRDEASAIMLSPDGTELVATGSGLAFILFDAGTGILKARHSSPSRDLGIIVRGCVAQDYFLTISPLGNCVVWDWHSKRPIDESRVTCDPYSIQLTPDGAQIAYMTSPGSALHLRPTLAPPDELALLGHGSGFKGARFLDKDHLFSVGNERALRLWYTPTGQEMKAIGIEASGLELDISRNGKWIALATTKGTKVMDRTSGTLLQEWPQDGQVWFAKFNASGTALATAGQQGILRVYDAHESNSANDDNLWSTRIQQPRHELKASASIHGLAIAADGSTIYTLDSPGCEVLKWDTKTGGREVLRAAEAGQTGRTAELSPDGRLLALGIDRHVEIWDIRSKRLIVRLRGPERKIMSLTFDHSGSRLFAGTVNGAITLWNLNSNEVLLSVPAHSSYVVCLAMSPDNSTLASTSFGGELKLWEGRTLTSAIARQRDVVQRASDHANRLLIRYKTPRKALEALAKDDSLSTQIMPHVLAVLQARMDAPVNLQALVKTNPQSTKASSDFDYKLRAEASSLKEQIDTAIGEDLTMLQNPTMEAPNHLVAARWNNLSRNLLQKSRFKLEPEQLIPLLAQLTESDQAPHYIVYLKGIAHVNLAQWETAEVELSRAIAAVPLKSPLWFEYAFRLAFLRAYLGKWDAYHELCNNALEGFSDCPDYIILERVAKMCLFSNQSMIDVGKAAQLADRAENQAVGGFSIYTLLTKGIADLRRKSYAEALNSLEVVAKRGIQQDKMAHDIIVALARMYAAIACHHLNRAEEADQHFEEAAKTVRSFRAGSGWWPDWMMAVLVMKEAEDLLAQPEK